MSYILGIDQSTQGTKAILTDESGRIAGRADIPHRQIISENGWISHDLEEIYQNVLKVSKQVVERSGINKDDIRAIGISNQRETSAAWDTAGNPFGYAVVWQCARAKQISDTLQPYAETIREKTGLPLSPYFPASKLTWLIHNVPEIHQAFEDEPSTLHLGTIDAFLIYRLTDDRSFKTDYSNASRTQLFNIHTLTWDQELCDLFDIPMKALPQICDSNAVFGKTDLEGFLDHSIPIHAVLGDSHVALFGQGCTQPGMVKITYGTGSSIMMNVGDSCKKSSHGLASSLAWGIDGKVAYVLEGNINYTGAVISWLKDDVKLISSPDQTSDMAAAANPADTSVLVPAFSGLSAPYWDGNAKAMLCGMTRTTGRSEIVRAALESIAFQINAILSSMKEDNGYVLKEVRADGGPTHNTWLMQFQSDISNIDISVSQVEELSALGAAYLSGISCGIYDGSSLFSQIRRISYQPEMDGQTRQNKLHQWNQAISMLIGNMDRDEKDLHKVTTGC